MSARLATAIVATGLALLASSPGAQAAFPGPNGQIVYRTGLSGLSTVSPDGSGNRVIVSDRAFDPEWSPDGRKIAYTTAGTAPTIYVIEADGSGANGVIGDGYGPAWSPDGEQIAFVKRVDNIGRLFIADADGSDEAQVPGLPDGVWAPEWSPDGSRIVFGAQQSAAFPPRTDLYSVEPDGSSLAHLTNGTFNEELPDWSPDGTKIVFTSRTDALDSSSVWVMNADGTGQVQLIGGAASDPSWSPDGTKIVFRHSYRDLQLKIMDPDGSNPQPLPQTGESPDWQPNPYPGHVRPKSATTTRFALVPAYHGCAASNEQHGPPLSFPSCAPPFEQSTTLAMGTPDANGLPANSESSAKLSAIAGNPGTPADDADVAVDASVTDVRCRATNAACPDGAGSDYTGSLLLTVSLRITDKLNGSTGTESATVGSQSLVRAPFACAATSDPATGSDCTLSTTADALVAGMVTEIKRTVWQLGQVEVYDSGPNGTGYASCPPICGNGDETTYLRQGIFVP